MLIKNLKILTLKPKFDLEQQFFLPEKAKINFLP